MGAEQLGMGMLGGMLGMFEKEQQNQQQERLMDIQKANQMELNKQMQKIQQENWENTNYDAQRKQMEKAGLNVGLMYGGQGGGGMTVSSGSGGSASGGTPAQAGVASGMAMQMANLAAQTEVAKAQARNLNADADVKEGKNPTGEANLANTAADTALKTFNAKNAEIQSNLGQMTFDEAVMGLKANYDKAQSEARIALTNANVTEQTKKSQIEKYKAETLNEAFKLAVMKSGIDVNQATIKKMEEDIKISKFNANTNATFQGIDKVAGGELTKLINYLYREAGQEDKQTHKLK